MGKNVFYIVFFFNEKVYTDLCVYGISYMLLRMFNYYVLIIFSLFAMSADYYMLACNTTQSNSLISRIFCLVLELKFWKH